MENNRQKNVNLGDLARGLFGFLQKAAATPPWTVKEKTGKWPEVEFPAVKEIATQLTTLHDEAAKKINEAYKERQDDIKGVVKMRRDRLVAYAKHSRVAVVDEKDKFVAAGRVTDKTTGVGLPNVKVKAFDMDRIFDDRLGSTYTDSLGYFRIEYTVEDFKDFGEGMPETYIEVVSEDKKILYTSPKSFVQKAGKSEYFDVQVEGDEVLPSLMAGKKIDHSIGERVKFLDRRKRSLACRTFIK